MLYYCRLGKRSRLGRGDYYASFICKCVLSDGEGLPVFIIRFLSRACVVNRSILFFCRRLPPTRLNSLTGSGVPNASPCMSSKQITDRFRCHFIFGQATSCTKSWKARVGFSRMGIVMRKTLFYQHPPETQRRKVTVKPDRNHPWGLKHSCGRFKEERINGCRSFASSTVNSSRQL